MLNSVTPVSETSETSETPETSITPADIKRQIFQPPLTETASAAIELAASVYSAANLPVKFSFDPEKEIPEDHTLSIVPITETAATAGSPRVPSALLVALTPSVQSVLNDAAGASWAVKRLTDIMIAQIKTAYGKMVDHNELLPSSVADFVSTGRVSEYAGYNAVAGDYIKALKKKSPALSFISKILLRQILASAEFAAQQFPRIEQKNWEFIIDAMVKSAAQHGHAAGILNYWRKTRDIVHAVTADVELDDIGALVQAQEEAAVAAKSGS